MFYFKYSKWTRWTVVINAVISFILGIVYIYNAHRIAETTRKITMYMAEHKIIRKTAIRQLLDAGEPLFLGSEFATYFGIVMAITTLVLLYFFKTNNNFMLVILTATSCFLSNVVGGAMIFYLMFSHKLESHEAVRRAQNQNLKQKNDWEDYINKRANQ